MYCQIVDNLHSFLVLNRVEVVKQANACYVHVVVSLGKRDSIACRNGLYRERYLKADEEVKDRMLKLR